MTTTLHIPTLETERLILGGFAIDHLEAFTAFSVTDRSIYLGGPADGIRDAWDSCLMHVGQWAVRGFGTFWVREAATGTPVGRVGIWYPITFDEPELSWVVYEDFEGKGYAAEAARAARNWAATEKGLGPLVSLIAPENTRSVVLAEKLGCVAEGEHTYPSGAKVTAYRHPTPEAL